MNFNLFAGLALACTVAALPDDRQAIDAMDGTIQYLPVNGGWNNFPFGAVGSVTPVMFHLYCPGKMNLTDLYCSGDQFAIYDNGVFLGETSMPIFNECASNSSNPDYNQFQANWSHGHYDLLPGWHNISIIPIKSPYNEGVGAIRVDTVKKEHHGHHEHHEPAPCCLDVCPIKRNDLVVVRTKVPRCKAEGVCESLGMHLAHINIHNFLDATTLAFECAGASSQSWVDDWNEDKYQGSCLVLSTGNQAPGGAINVPNCCAAHLPVICQKKPCDHPRVQYACNACKRTCHCHRGECRSCLGESCHKVLSCGLLQHHEFSQDA